MELTRAETEKVQSTFGHPETAVHSMTVTWTVMRVLCGQSGTGLTRLSIHVVDAILLYIELDMKH